MIEILLFGHDYRPWRYRCTLVSGMPAGYRPQLAQILPREADFCPVKLFLLACLELVYLEIGAVQRSVP
jgi:hypothetical protein